MKEDFVLPKKWFVTTDSAEKEKIVREYFNKTFNAGINSYKNYEVWHFIFPSLEDLYCIQTIPADIEHSEITFDQFKQYVLGEKQQQKEIVGWKLKEEYVQYKDVAARIANYNPDYDIQNLYLKDSTHNFHGDEIIPILKQAGVLYLWFEPVYKQ